jgi:predicted nucleic acid-binding protein
MAVLIDSSVFIAMERRGAGTDVVLALVPDEPVALAAISASELLFGVERANTPERRVRRELFVEALLALIPILPFGTAEARAHARVWAQLAASGQIIGAHDLLIAVTALVYDYDVLTDNIREFRRVPGLAVRQPAWPT